MSQADVTQITVRGYPVGILGLKTVIQDMSGEYMERPDWEVMEELLNRLRQKNYIPDKARADYGKALLREFKRFVGKPYEEEAERGIEIKVLGPGCAQCDRIEQELMQLMNEIGIMASIEHVRDMKEIGKYGVIGIPALLINGEVKSVGKAPLKSKMIQWLKEAEEEHKNRKSSGV